MDPIELAINCLNLRILLKTMSQTDRKTDKLKDFLELLIRNLVGLLCPSAGESYARVGWSRQASVWDWSPYSTVHILELHTGLASTIREDYLQAVPAFSE